MNRSLNYVLAALAGASVPVRESPLAWWPPAVPISDPSAVELRRRTTYATSHQRVGTFDRHALPERRLRRLIARLCARLGLTPSGGRSLLCLVSLLLGMRPHVGAKLRLHGPAFGDRIAVWIDVECGCARIDYGAFLLIDAAHAPDNGTALPATHIYIKALPVCIVEALRAWLAVHPEASTLAELCGCGAPAGTDVLDEEREIGRLRSTAHRALNGLSAFAMRIGIDRYNASIVATAPQICHRSRMYYVRSDPEQLGRDLDHFYTELGLGPAYPVSTSVPFGSLVVPPDWQVEEIFRNLCKMLDDARPPRRYGLDALIAFHNIFMLAAGTLLVFMLGLREAKVLDLSAARVVAGAKTCDVDDETSGDSPRCLPVLLGPLAREQIARIWEHMHELDRRATLLGVSETVPWRAHLRAVLRGEDVPLLFEIRKNKAKPIGTTRLCDLLPPDKQWVPNAGRHYWQTFFTVQRFLSEVIDRWARHGPTGLELCSSIDVYVEDAVVEPLLEAQHVKADQLRIRVFRGLVTRRGSS